MPRSDHCWGNYGLDAGERISDEIVSKMNKQNIHLSLDEAVVLLKESGLRKTVARTHLLQCVSELESPKTQAEICELLAAHGFDASTIFRGLTDLTEVGLIVRIDTGDHLWRFEMRDCDMNGNLDPSHHPHAICIQCGAMTCLQNELLHCCEEHTNGWTFRDLNLRGVCPECRVDERSSHTEYFNGGL